MSERDFPDFVSAKDGDVYRVLVCNGRDEPFPLRSPSAHEGAVHRASSEVYCFMAATRWDDDGLYWHALHEVEYAVDIARKAVGR